MAKLLNALAQLCYIADQRRWVTLLTTGLAVAAVIMMALNRPTSSQPPDLVEVPLDTITNERANTFVKVSGTLAPSRMIQTRVSMHIFSWNGNRFIPMTAPGSPTSLMVLDANLLGDARTGAAPITLIGRVVQGRAPEPSVYLRVESLPVENMLSPIAQVGMLLMAVLLLMGVVRWLIRRANYAIELIPLRPHLPNVAPDLLLWFGSLGNEYNGFVLRQTPARLRTRTREATFEFENTYDHALKASLRKLNDARETVVTCSHGFLPALKIWFEDERGLPRTATLVCGSRAFSHRVLDVLRHTGL